MSVTVILELTPRPDAVDGLRAELARQLPATRAFDGCESLQLLATPDRARFVAVERWVSTEAYGRYVAWRSERGDVDRLGAHLERHPRLSVLDDESL